VLANRHDLPLEPGVIATQKPQAGERVDWGTVIGVTISAERPEWMRKDYHLLQKLVRTLFTTAGELLLRLVPRNLLTSYAKPRVTTERKNQ